MLTPCRLCGHQVSTLAERCPYCGIARPAEGLSSAPPPLATFPVYAPAEDASPAAAERKAARRRAAREHARQLKGEAAPPRAGRKTPPSPSTAQAPAPAPGRISGVGAAVPRAPITAQEEDSVFLPDLPRERVHGARGKLLMLAMGLAGAALTVRGCTWYNQAQPTSAGTDAVIIASGLGLLGTTLAMKKWWKVGFWAPLALLSLLAGTTVLSTLGPILSGAGAGTWLPTLLTVLGFFTYLDYFGRRKELFGGRGSVLETPAPRPFQLSPYVASGVMGRSGRQAARMNAMIAINNVIAREKTVAAAPIEMVRRVPREFGLSLGQLEAERKALYRAYLQHFLANGDLSADERAEMARLAGLLMLDEKAVKEVERAVARQLYRWRAKAALRDGRIDAAEHADLSRIRAEMELPGPEVSAIHAELAASSSRARRPAAALDAVEKEDLKVLALRAGAPAPADGTRAQLERLRLYEQVKTSVMPVEEAAAPLAAGEICHAVREVEAFHLMAPDAGLPPGRRPWPARPRLEPRAWLGPEPDEERELPDDDVAPVAAGQLHLTNRRLILANPAGTDALELRDVTQATTYANGVELRMRSGVALFMAFSDRVEELAMLLDRAVAALAAGDAAKEAHAAVLGGRPAATDERMVPDVAATSPSTDETPPLVDDARERDGQSQT
jgi:hypothetical protein